MNTIIGTFVLMHAFAAGAKAPASQDVLLKLNLFAHTEGQFIQIKTLQELDVQIKTEGTFSIKKSVSNKSLFHWSIKKPTESLICIDSEGIEITSSSTDRGSPAKKKKIKFSEMGSETNDQVINLFKLLSLDQESATQLFTIEKSGKGFLLIPKNKQKSLFQTVRIEINKQGLVENLLVEEKSQDKIEIHFFNIKTRKIFPASETKSFLCEK